ncbi:hypothetical protein BD310DRAFT_935609 [Dichomitus squalens]|uniref:Uncharacterized protein n=1 Tax=Dichomitus squalens TaxID=114155 RepID=A0A4Q9PKE1_9APHY|nr:hypothetical protein BD310DRAFT_935609 [Dichomitus squalens]
MHFTFVLQLLQIIFNSPWRVLRAHVCYVGCSVSVTLSCLGLISFSYFDPSETLTSDFIMS